MPPVEERGMETASLPPRLLAVAESIPRCDTLADVGTDRAALPAYLLSAGRCRRAIGIDRSRRALAAARQGLEDWGLGDRCELRLGDGLAPLGAAEADVIVVAGVGARLMVRMLDAELPRLAGATPAPLVICQPMSEPHLVRRWLDTRGRALGAGLLRESLVEDAGRYYHLMVAGAPSQEQVRPVADRDLGRAGRTADPLAAADLGLHLLAGPDPLLVPYLKWRRESLRYLAAKAGASGSAAGIRKAEAARLLEAAFARTQQTLEQDRLG